MAPSKRTDLAGRFADSRVSVNLSPREAVEFVQKLASDDDFRSAFEADPEGCLADHHINLPVGNIPKEVKLPPKEDLKDVLNNITIGDEFRIDISTTTNAAAFIAFVAFLAFFKK